MEPVKLASGLGAHGPQILYPGPRQPPPGHPPGPQIIHPSTTSFKYGRVQYLPHEGSPYKGTISPPVVSRGVPYSSYASIVDGGHAGASPRYIQQPTYLAYQRESHFPPRISDRPVLLPQAPKRPSIMGGYGGYARDMMQMIPTSTMPVSSMSAGDSCKRIKLNPPPKPDVRFPPLIVDTSETNHSTRESSYYPQVEAISPTLPPDPRDESPLHSTRDDLIKQIEQVDKEISLTDASLSNLKKKEKELEVAAAAALKGDTVSPQDPEENKDLKHQSTAQIIYAENRKVAEEGHNSLSKLIPPSEMPRVLPLYHQPSDTEVYQQNKAKYSVFKRRLLEYFKRKQEMKLSQEQQITQTYTKLMTEWLKKVDKVENSKKHRERVAKNRELFEKVFPELRKQREDKERFSRVGARVKSDAEMEEIIDGIQDQENEDKKMRAYAVIPPMLLDDKRRLYRYNNMNSLIESPMTEYKERRNINIWTDQENDVFKEKYLHHPKNFVVISSYLERKSVADAIQNYYLSKKKQNYKMLVKRRLRRPRNKGSAQAASIDPMVSINPTSGGVTTRGSLAAHQKEMGKNGSSMSNANNTMTSYPGSLENATAGSAAITTVINWPTSSIMAQLSNSNTLAAVKGGSDHQVDSASRPGETSPSMRPPQGTEGHVTNDVDAAINPSSQEVHEKDKENLTGVGDKLGRRDNRCKDEDSSDEENSAEHGRGGPHECVLCKTRLEHFGQSRPVSSGQASQYGLSESTLPPNARVCSNCRCRAVKRRVPQCLIPTCTTSKWRVKRLRPFPSRWSYLPQSLRDPIIKELQIPNDVMKSCSACHNRILRKLGADAEEPLDPTRWSEADIEALRDALKEVGCHWSRVAQKLGSKSQGQCKSFYFNLKEKYRLDEALSEYRKSKGKSGPPTVTDEEESGSSTSSCEDPGALPPPLHHPPPQVRHDSASDTASASSPPPSASANNCTEGARSKEMASRESIIKQPLPPGSVPAPSGGHPREDNDSSATASADEGQNGAGGRESPPEVQHIPHPGERRPPGSTPTLSSVSLNNGNNGGNNHFGAPRGGLMPPVTGSSPVSSASASPAPSFKQILDTAIEATIARSSKSQEAYRGTNDAGGAEPSPHNDHITISSLLENSSFSHKAAVSAPPRSWEAGAYPHEIQGSRGPKPEAHPATTYEDCEGGLDLTVKKRDRCTPPSQSNTPRDVPTITMRGGAEVIPTTTVARGSPPRAHSNSISYSQNTHGIPEHNRNYLQDYVRKSPGFPGPDSRASLPNQTIANMVSRVPSPHFSASQSPLPKTSKSSMAPPPSIPSASRVTLTHVPPSSQNVAGRVPLKSEKGSVTLRGSITHGTASINQHGLTPSGVSQASRYEIMTKPSLAREGGSITQGTPIHHDVKRGSIQNTKEGTLMVETRSGVEIIPRPSLSMPVYDRDAASYRSNPLSHPRPSISTPSSYPPSGPPFSGFSYAQSRAPYSDSQITSRQIIETDYLTSQQMASRREKDMRVPSRGREQVPRDHRGYPTPSGPSVFDRRTLESHQRGLESRPPDHQRTEHTVPAGLDLRDLRTSSSENDKQLRKVQFVRTSHGYVPIHTGQQQAQSQIYLGPADARVSRPSQSPVSIRETTITPPSAQGTVSPHREFRSQGGGSVSNPTPPPRLSSVIQRQPPQAKLPSHLTSNKSASPRPESDRYSPHGRHHLTVIPTMGVGEPLNMAEMIQRPGASYPGLEVRRDAVSSRTGFNIHHSGSSHERHQLEGIGKQMVETLQNNRNYIGADHGQQSNERDKEHHEDRRFYERVDYGRARHKDEYRSVMSGKMSNKETSNEEADPGKVILNYQVDQGKGSQVAGKPGRVQVAETITAASLIDAIITSHISQGNIEEAGRDPRPSYRREGDPHIHGHPGSDHEKRGRSPATNNPYHHIKEKEVLSLDSGTDLSMHQRHQVHKGNIAALHSTSAHHPSYSKANQAHLDSNVSVNADPKKLVSASPHYSSRPPPLEITRSDGRSTLAHLSGLYEHSKMRSQSIGSGHFQPHQSPEKDVGSSGHRPGNHSTGVSGAHPMNSPNVLNERQIIRIAQPPPRSDNPFDYIKNKLQEIWREDTPPDNVAAAPDKRPPSAPHDTKHHPRSLTPINRGSHPPSPHQPPTPQSLQHPNRTHPPHNYDEEHLKKRPRLDGMDGLRSRPAAEARPGAPMMSEAKDEVADSPQSGEMVIDESPREGSKPPSAEPSQDKARGVAHPPSHYSNAYPVYRSGGGNSQPSPQRSGGNWGMNAAPPPTISSGGRPQGYEPNVEPVSDDD